MRFTTQLTLAILLCATHASAGQAQGSGSTNQFSMDLTAISGKRKAEVSRMRPAVGVGSAYRHQYAEGWWHVVRSDKGAPRAVAKITDEKPDVNLYVGALNDAQVLYLGNTYHGPAEVEIEITDGKNFVSRLPSRKRVVIPAGCEHMALAVSPVVDPQDWAYRVEYYYVPGQPGAVHTPSSPYRVPFCSQSHFPVSQGFFGKYTHTDLANRYAVDIVMPEGTPVCAARPGIVMAATDEYVGNGMDVETYGTLANTVRVLHNDGTMAVYAHLQPHSIRIRPGAHVAEGEAIASSGNTGLSTAPHLHFVIQRNAGMTLESLPFEFRDESGNAFTPEAGTWLVSSTPPARRP